MFKRQRYTCLLAGCGFTWVPPCCRVHCSLVLCVCDARTYLLSLLCLQVFPVYEAHLASNKFLAGEQLSLADISHAPYTQVREGGHGGRGTASCMYGNNRVPDAMYRLHSPLLGCHVAYVIASCCKHKPA